MDEPGKIAAVHEASLSREKPGEEPTAEISKETLAMPLLREGAIDGENPGRETPGRETTGREMTRTETYSREASVRQTRDQKMLAGRTIDPDTAPLGVMQAMIMHAFQLKRIYREAFILCDIQGRSISEAAFILGAEPSAVSARLDRARRQMSEVSRGLCEH